MLWYMISWIINFLIIAVIVAIVDELTVKKIEEYQGIGAFFIFFLPTFLEVFSYILTKKPFLANLA